MGERKTTVAAEEASSNSGFQMARSYGGVKQKQRRVVKSLIAMDPELQEQYMHSVLDELDQRWGTLSRRNEQKLPIFQRFLKTFFPGPNNSTRIAVFLKKCLNGDTKGVERFVAKGGDPSVTDDDGRNGIYYACVEGAVEVVKTLNVHRINLTPVCQLNGFTPLHLCAIGGGRGHVQCAQY